ncbi:hypothetical protein [Variovorax sp. ZT4R33]|uniref:hypothetical protein n=1 Tax=Variovorax sp. ZT4R33 TaxID=3443743 RepID=UPI003F447CD7
MTTPERATHSTPAEKAMKQTAKTTAETRGNDPDDDAAVGPNDGPAITRDREVSPGDAPVGRSGSDGSSPYEEPNHRAKKQRSD